MSIYKEIYLYEARDFVTIYHIGKTPAIPQPNRSSKERIRGKKVWSAEEKLAFFSTDYLQIRTNHGISGNVYAYRAPTSILQNEVGFKSKYDGASEIIIGEEDFKKLKFLGKVMDQKELEEKAYQKMKDEARYDDKIEVMDMYDKAISPSMGDEGIEERKNQKEKFLKLLKDLNFIVSEVVLKKDISNFSFIIKRKYPLVLRLIEKDLYNKKLKTLKEYLDFVIEEFPDHLKSNFYDVMNDLDVDTEQE